MESTNLRIGNIVDLGNRIAKIIEISHLSCAVMDLEETQDTIEDYERVKGLVLTDEWFEKWGFYKDGEYQCRSICDYNFCFRYRDWAKNWAFYQEYTDSPNPDDDRKKYPIAFDIKYVHQLQNLWYSLLHYEITHTKD